MQCIIILLNLTRTKFKCDYTLYRIKNQVSVLKKSLRTYHTRSVAFRANCCVHKTRVYIIMRCNNVLNTPFVRSVIYVHAARRRGSTGELMSCVRRDRETQPLRVLNTHTHIRAGYSCR